MPKYAAFLRAINVGGRVVKMEALRELFTGMGFSNVQTFIASGNVVFQSPQRSVGRVEQAIEQRLHEALGYSVTTFVRSLAELAALAEHPLVSGDAVEDGAGLYVAFVREKPTAEATRKLMALATEAEAFHVYQHHVLWLVRGRFSDSQLSRPSLERALGVPATVRSSTTVRKMAQKFKAG